MNRLFATLTRQARCIHKSRCRACIHFIFAVFGLALMLLVTFPPTNVLPRFAGTVKMSTALSKSFPQDDYDHLCRPVRAPLKGTPPNQVVYALRDVKAPTFLPEFKNPCWKKVPPLKPTTVPLNEESISCLPYFHLAGFPKCGTTDLYDKLMGHPLIARGAEKEPLYITRGMYGDTPCRKGEDMEGNVSCSVSFYSSRYFKNAAQKILANDYKLHGLQWPVNGSEFKHPMITVDGSSITIWDNSNYWRIAENVNCTSPYVLQIDYILKINPNVKIVIIMRDPVERTYSDYVFYNKVYHTDKKVGVSEFHELSKSFISAFNHCVAMNQSLRHCAYYAQRKEVSGYEHLPRAQISLYHVYLADWFKRLPRDRFLFLRTQDFHDNMGSELNRVFRFLGLPPLTPEAMEKVTNGSTKNVSDRKKRLGAMLPETRLLWEEFFRPHNEKLAELLEDEKFLWRTT